MTVYVTRDSLYGPMTVYGTRDSLYVPIIVYGTRDSLYSTLNLDGHLTLSTLTEVI